jgi:hypothetical protein
MTIQTIGRFLEAIPESQEYLTLNFALGSTPQRQERWRNYGLSADFLGDYFSAFFPRTEVIENSINLKDTVKASVSYIANELLENAVKYSDASVDLPISITLRLYNQEMIFQVTNYSSQTIATAYQEFVEAIQFSDLDTLYIQQLEKTALGEDGSHMGLLTILKDYSATGGWKFEPLLDAPTVSRVNVMVHLVV